MVVIPWRLACTCYIWFSATIISLEAYFHSSPLLYLSRPRQEMLSNHEIDELIKKRDHHRALMEYQEADAIKSALEAMNIEISDISYKCEGNSQWKFKNAVVEEVETDLMGLAHSCADQIASQVTTEAEVCALAKDCLRLQGFSQEQGDAVVDTVGKDERRPIPVVQRSMEMQGRKYADAAFEFCMAGICDDELYLQLADCCAAELRRFGHRKSCNALQIVQMVEKLAVAGVRGHAVYSIATALLETKAAKMARVSAEYDLFSGRAMLWLWRHATKQKKPTKVTVEDPTSDAPSCTSTLPAEHSEPVQLPNFADLYTDPSLPLVLDLGCGYGVSLLRLCQLDSDKAGLRKMNFLGVDLNNRAVRYASGISRRWGQQGRCAFAYADCADALRWVRESYPGSLAMVMVNFPTPYAVDAVLERPSSVEKVTDAYGEEEAEHMCGEGAQCDGTHAESAIAGNSQLPDGFRNFMFNMELVDLITEAVVARAGVAANTTAPSSLLLLQSNVEDVVVTMSNMVKLRARERADAGRACSGEGFAVPDESSLDGAVRTLYGAELVEPPRWRTCDELVASTDISRGGGRISQRLQTWLTDLECSPVVDGKMGTAERSTDIRGRSRACGVGWLHANPLPGNARTETEVHCEVEKQPVHRCLFAFTGSK